jgi:hypothetical protein
MYGLLSELIAKGWPQTLTDALQAAFERETDGLEFCDNFRACRYADDGEHNAYVDAKDNGCCGFWDGEFTVDGVTVLYGFNYGH